ncbi:CBS domain-containing protein [Ramlibacter sp. MMS24-I3-19]|uniref:CBS domain-containing protein n=1 Tax=Ramlibacter sp. MMS24-I3-19 TaxID=3416606 RepID=UPI003CFFCC4D
MELPVTIRFVGLAPVSALEDEIHAQVNQLARLRPEAIGWRVTVQRQEPRQQPGDLLSVRVELALPDRDLAITRSDEVDASAALRKAMQALRGELQAGARPGAPAHGADGAATPLTAADVCTRRVVFTDRGMMLDEAARLMRSHHVGSLVVVEERSPRERIVVGMVTDRDITMAVVALDRDPRAFRVADIMSREVATVRESDSVLDVLALMRRKKVRRVPVTGPGGELVGLVALDDMLAVVAEQMQALGAAVGAAQRHELTSTSAA